MYCPKFAPFIENNNNFIKAWQENLIKDKQNLANLNVADLIDQAKFYGKN